MGLLRSLAVFVAIYCAVPVVAAAATLAVDCDAGEKIQPKVNQAKPGDIFEVVGTCSENVLVQEEVYRITIDGRGKAIIKGPDAKRGTFLIRGRGILIKQFSISGGQDE